MSSFDPHVAIERGLSAFQPKVDDPNSQIMIEAAKKRVYRMVDSQLSDFSLGLSPHFTPDPHTFWDPMLITLIFGCDLTIEETRKSLGYDKTQKNSEISNTPNKRIARKVLKEMGHGEFWDRWPACGGKAVDSEEYKEAMTKLSRRIMQNARMVKECVMRSSPWLLETLQRLAESDNDWQQRLNDIWTAAATELHRELPLEEWGLDFDCSSMPQMPMADFHWAKENYERVDLWQRGIFISPRMFFKEDKSCSKGNRQRTARAACIAPSINMATVSNPTKLLAILSDRHDYHPGSDCFRKDYLSTHVGRTSRLLVGLFCGNTCVELKDSTPEKWLTDELAADARIVSFVNHNTVSFAHSFPNLGLMDVMHNEQDTSWEDALVQRAKGPSRLKVTKRVKGADVHSEDAHLLYGSGEAHVTLVSQCLIYGFLQKVVEMVVGETKSSRKPDPPTEDLKKQQMWYNQMENANATHEPGKSDNLLSGEPHYGPWDELVQEKVHRAIQDIHRLWNDATTFWEEFQLELDHHYCWLPEVSSLSRYVKSKSRLTDERGYRWDVYYDVVGCLMRRNMRDVLMWTDIMTCFQRLADMKTPRARIGFGQGFGLIVQGWIIHYLSELTRRGIFACSSPSRQQKLFRRSTPMEALVTEHDDKLRKTSLSFTRIQVDKSATWAASLTADEQEAIKAMHDLLGNPVAINQFSLKNIIKHICQLMSNPDASALFTDRVRKTVDTLALLLDLLERVDPHMHDFTFDRNVFRTQGGHSGSEMDELAPSRAHSFRCFMHYEAYMHYGGEASVQMPLDEGLHPREKYCGPHVAYSLMIDRMEFEDDSTVAYKRCLRLYDWIDQKLGFNETPYQHGDAHAMIELRSVCYSILTVVCDDELVLTSSPTYELLGKRRLNLRDSLVMDELLRGLNTRITEDQVGYDDNAWVVEAPKQPKQLREERLQKRRAKRKGADKRKQRSKEGANASAVDATAGSRTEASPKNAPSPPKTPSPKNAPSPPKTPSPTAASALSDSSPHSAGFFERKRKFERALEQPPLDTGYNQPSPDYGEAEDEPKRQKMSDEEEEETPQTATPAAEDSPKLDENLAKLKLGNPKNPKKEDKIKLPSKHWQTLRTLFDPGARGTLTSKDLETAFNRLGYRSEHPGGSVVKLVIDKDMCPWYDENEKIVLESGERTDRRMIQYHPKHGGTHGDSVLHNGLVKVLKKRIEGQGITLKFIQKWFTE